MGKIKLSLVSGAIVEKPLINAFKANNSSYVVLDNEMNGSMGLPIILVCKLENNKLTKIVDQNEWQIVKEYLKNIIAGNQIEFISVNSELQADDIYYTQLTLPVPSFDALKNSYNVESNTISSPNGGAPTMAVNNPSPMDNTASIMDINFSNNGTPTLNSNVATPNPEMSNPNITPVSSENGVAPTNMTEPEIPTPPVTPMANENIINNVNNSINGSGQPEISPASPVIDVPQNPITPEAPTTVPPVSPISFSQEAGSLDAASTSSPVSEPTNMGIGNSAPAIDLGIPNMSNVAAGSEGPVGVNPVLNSPVPNGSDNIVNPVSPVASEMPEAPVISNIPTGNEGTVNMDNNSFNEPITNDMFKEQKEAFMQACENMFDALVQKFEKELENKR